MRCLMTDLGSSPCLNKLNLRCAATRVARVGILLLFWMVAAQASAQIFTTLCSFNNTNGDLPNGGLSLIGSTLYGTTEAGGANSFGTVFSIATSGGSPTTLGSFTYSNGESPSAGLTLNGSTLYGTTSYGGAKNNGTVFSIATSGGSPNILCSFSGSNGAGPCAGLTLNGSTLYGTTATGEANNDGMVFSIATSGGSPTTLCTFSGSNGYFQQAGLTLNGSTLYGETYYGGAKNDGTVFSIATSGGSPTMLCSFSGSNGANAAGGLTLVGSTLYGITCYGGANGDGTVFSIATSGGSPTTLCSFSGSNKGAQGSLTLIGSTLYGTTYEGGNLSLNAGLGLGTVFSIATSGGSPTTLCSFSGSNGCLPSGGLTFNGSTLYGAATGGGANDYGAVFAFNIGATIALANVQNAAIITGGTGTVGMIVSNSSTCGLNLNYTLGAAAQSGSATFGAMTAGTGSLAPSASQSCTVAATSTNLGINTVAITASDPNSSNLSQTATATLTVLDHAAAAFAGGGTTLNLNFGTLQVGSGTQSLQFQIQNLPAACRAGLDLDSVMVLSDSGGVFSTDAMPFTDLAPGSMSNNLDLFLDTSQVGQFSGEYQFNLSDEQDLSGHAGTQTLTLNVTATVVPEPSTLALLGAGVLMGWVWARWFRGQGLRD